ncbi:MAG: NCS2 family permease [Bacteroidales bacterium]|nr:NCS2 family permease [Bacteroidales bacterium]
MIFDKFFGLRQHNTTIRREFVAGATTFMTMAYILAVNPSILSETGMDKGALFTATALASVIGTLLMAFMANLPFALAPGMGLNAFFAFTVVIGMGYSWQTALTAVFAEGALFVLMSFFNIREAIVNSIPISLKHAISVGIGFFIALIGLKNAGIVVSDTSSLVRLGNLHEPSVWVAIAGFLIISALLILKVRGAILLGIVGATIMAIPTGLSHFPANGLFSAPPSLSPVLLKLEFRQIFTPDILMVLFTFLFVDIFDTVGTLVGVCSKAGLIDKKGKIPKVKQALLADAMATTTGALLGTSTVTTYVESAAGIAEGGKTGLTAFFVALFFIASIFFSPLFLMVPQAATAPALIIIGLFMVSPITKVELENYAESIPAFITIIMMPLAFSISEGIAFGIISYVVLSLLTGNRKNISLTLFILALLFCLKYIFM